MDEEINKKVDPLYHSDDSTSAVSENDELLKKWQREIDQWKKNIIDEGGFVDDGKLVQKVTCHDIPDDWKNRYVDDERANIHIEDLSTALLHCLNILGVVDIEYIATITKLSYGDVINGLKGAIYQNPMKWGECFFRGWELSDDYLSGNIIHKWRVAMEENDKYHGYFKDNVDALERLIPASLRTKDIYVTLGSPWIPPDIIDEFIYYLVGEPVARHESITTKYDEHSGLWEIPYKSRFKRGKHSVKASSLYGTADMDMLHIIENTLNMKTLVVYQKVNNAFSKKGEVFVPDQSKTLLVLEKQRMLIEKFQSWIWDDEERKERLQILYETRFGAHRKREFDGSFLTFPQMNPNVTLFPFQRNAVARIILTPNTLLAHDVGSGKTYVMIASGMEMRRIGISKKNMYVLPNNLIGQWKTIFMEMYPSANILVVEPKDFVPTKRNATMAKIKSIDYDAILMAYSCFDMIPLSLEYYEKEYERVLQKIKQSRATFESKASVDRKHKSLLASLEKLKKELEENEMKITFDQLGINTLFVDEAHNYKNVPIDTKITRILGISKNGSRKCSDMLDKVKCVQKQNGGRGVVFATGTPITNSITDAYVMQSYLQSGELALLGLTSFDSWVGMFAEKSTDFEVDVDTTNFRMATRFAKFHNLPELTSILASIADFHAVDKTGGMPDFNGYTDSVISPTPAFKDYLKEISSRADDVRSRRVPPDVDNMLKITNHGRLAALDLRLVDNTARFTLQSKVARCAECIIDTYNSSSKTKSAQLVFCDISTPKIGFNMYDELARLLVFAGVPREEIAFVHDGTTDKKRDALFQDVRDGKIRVLIGSTAKLGMGVNVQERLIAIHHLDVPWRPADMVQREGRILRQGNTSEKIYIFRYVTDGSFDAYSWQLLESKARFIAQLLGGSMKMRSGSDVDSAVLNYAEVKALAIGNPLIKDRVIASNELEKFYILQREALLERDKMNVELSELPKKIDRQKSLIETCERDILFYSNNKREYSPEDKEKIRSDIANSLRANVLNPEETEVLTYQGFQIFVPSFMRKEQPCVYIRNNGKYIVDMGSESSILKRIDEFLDNFSEVLASYKASLNAYYVRQSELSSALANKIGYQDKIEELQEKLKEIDERLGVKHE
ncbi:MAG: DEAD/DEAH box helicase family protein [Clostridia bacterium]|nr:DEAD/DEAH box helicase family protein [Clostridia bacterium]